MTAQPRSLRAGLPLLVGVLVAGGHLALSPFLPDLAFLKYPAAARLFLEGSLDLERLVDFSPLYLGLHTLAVRVGLSPDLFRLGQIVLVGVAAALLVILVRRRFGTRGAILAAAVFAFDRNVLVYERVLEPEIVLLVFALAFLALAECAGWRAAGAAGTAAVLALATRPSLLPVVAAAPVYFALRPGEPGWRARGREILAFSLPVVVGLVLLAAHAGRATGDPRTPVMNPGTVFFEGNNPLSRGTSAVYPPVVAALARQPDGPTAEPDRAHRHYREVARASAGRPLSVREVNDFWRQRALQFMRDEPGRWLGLLRDKVLLAFHNGRLHDVATAWILDRAVPMPTVPFAIVAALGLVGALTLARRWRENLLVYALVFSQLAVMLAFYVSARQRVPILPGLLLFAVAAIVEMRRDGKRPLMLLSALLALCLVLPHPVLREENDKKARAFEAIDAFAELRESFAVEPPSWHAEAIAEAIAAQPWLIDDQRPAYVSQDAERFDDRVLDAMARRGETTAAARFDRGVMAWRGGDPGEAERLWSQVEDEGYRPYRLAAPATVAYWRAEASRLAGPGGGNDAGHIERALALAPGDPWAMGALYARHRDEAVLRRMETYWSTTDVQWIVGRALLATGDRAARAPLEAVAADVPSLRAVWVYLVLARALDGDLDAAVVAYQEAVRRSIDPVLLDPEVPEVFRRWAAVGEADEQLERRVTLATVLYAYGYLREGLDVLEPVLARGTDVTPAAAREAARLQRLMRWARREDSGLSPSSTTRPAGPTTPR